MTKYVLISKCDLQARAKQPETNVFMTEYVLISKCHLQAGAFLFSFWVSVFGAETFFYGGTVKKIVCRLGDCLGLTIRIGGGPHNDPANLLTVFNHY